MAFPPVLTPTNAYTLTLSDGTTIAVASGSYTTVGGLNLPGTNEVITAVQLSDNFLHITERFASTTAPVNPLVGQLWYDKNSPKQMKIWDGVVWKPFYLEEDLVDPANTTTVPAPSSGTGVSANPYIITDTAISGERTLVATVTVTGLVAGSVISIVDLNGGSNGGRFEFTNNVVDGAGNLVFDIYLDDQPPSVTGTVYTANVKIGTSSAYIDMTITMSANFPQSVTYPTGVFSSSTPWASPSNTLTPSGCLEISNDNATWVVNPATLSINNGQTLYTRWSGTAGSGTCIDSAEGTTITGSITDAFGGVTNGSLTVDKTPSAITFTSQTGVAVSSVISSNTITISGINSYAYINGTTTGTVLEASINGGAWTSVPAAAGTTMPISNGQTLQLRHTTGATLATAYVATIDVGGLTGVTFSTTTVASTPSINTPSITTPVSGSTGISLTVTLTGSAYTAVNGAGTHLSTDWEIFSDAALTTPVAAATSTGDTVNLTSYTIPTGALSYSTQYWARIRYRDNTGGTPVVSSYSTVIDFTTGAQLGVNWTYRSGLSSTAWSTTSALSVAWDGSQYVAVGLNGAVATSPDGITWTYRNSLSLLWGVTDVLDINWNGSQYVAIGEFGRAATSPDGITWTNQSQLTISVWGNVWAVNRISWDGAQYLVVGGGGLAATSPDGITWTYRSGLSGTAWGSTFAWVNNWNGSQFIVAGQNGAVATSPDGITWTYRSGLSGTAWGTNTVFDIKWDGSQYVAVGSNGAVATSPDGITWTYRSGLSGTAWGTNTARRILYDGTQYAVVGQNGAVATSPDGITWTYRAGLSGTAWGATLAYYIIYDGSQYLVVGDSGKVATSP